MTNYIEKIEDLLISAEGAFNLTQNELTHPKDFDGLWQRANYRLALAQAYTGLLQVQNIESFAGSADKIANSVEKEINEKENN